MLGIFIGTAVTAIVAYLIIKRAKPQAVLFLGGMVLMAAAVLMGHDLLDAKKTTGFIWFDIFKYIENMFNTRAGGMGMYAMAIGGFASYMNYTGASKTLVKLTVKPLYRLRSPYLVLALAYLIGQFLNLFISSAAGLGLLLMATIYPILVNLGVSRLSATAVIGTTACLDLGPSSGNSMMAAQYSGMDPTEFFAIYQMPVGGAAAIVIAVLHFFVQKWFDKRDGYTLGADNTLKPDEIEDAPPTIYAILPILPLFLIMAFSKLGYPGIKITVITSMFMVTALAMLFELIRYRNIKKVFDSMQVFFEGMGKLMATVVTLIVAGETFAYGLQKIGMMDALIHSAQAAGFGAEGMTIIMTAIIAVSALIMGSGNAPFFAFSALAPMVAAKMGIAVVGMLVPMQLAAGIMRSMSPISAVIVAVAGVSEVSPVDVAKRTAIPMLGALLTTTILGAFMI